MILTGRNAERLQHAASEVDALSTASFDAADPVALERFFRDLPTIDHVMGDSRSALLRTPRRYGLRQDSQSISASTSCRRFTSRAMRPTKSDREGTLIMTNTALTGATYDIDGGQQFVAA